MGNKAVKYIVGGCMVAAGIICISAASIVGGREMWSSFPSISLTPYGIVYKTIERQEETVENIEQIRNLNIDISDACVTVQPGDVDNVEIVCENIREKSFKLDTNGDTLKIKYNLGFTLFNFGWNGAEITITIPRDKIFQQVEVHTGVGESNISGLKATDKMFFDMGVGRVSVSDISSKELKIDSGVGEVEITDSITEHLDMDSGVGAVSYQGQVNGNVDIDCGVGDTRIELEGRPEDYRFKVDKGLGDVTLNGTSISNYGDGSWLFDIDSGVGSVTIRIG